MIKILIFAIAFLTVSFFIFTTAKISAQEYEKLPSPVNKSTCDAGFWDLNGDSWTCDGSIMNHDWYGPGGGDKHESFNCPEQSICMKEGKCTGCYKLKSTPIPTNTPTPTATPKPAGSSSQYSTTNISGTVTIGGNSSVSPATIKIEMYGTDPEGHNNNWGPVTYGVVGLSSIGYNVDNNYTYKSVDGKTGTVNYTVKLFDSSGNTAGEGGGNFPITYGQSNPKSFTVNATTTSTTTTPTTTTTPVPLNDNSCVSYDPPYNNQNPQVFFCDPKNSCQNGRIPYSNPGLDSCSNGGSCCYDKAAYDKRQLKGEGSGSSGATNTPVPNSSGSPTTAPASSDYCSAAGKGTFDTSYGGSTHPGYNQPSCDGKLIGETDPKTAVKGRKYADRYQCTQGGVDGKKYVDKPGGSQYDYICDSYPWIDTPPTQASLCKATKAQTCAVTKDSKGNTVPDTSNPNYCCKEGLNLFCDDKTNPASPQCQYNATGAPSPTAGQPPTSGCVNGSRAQGCRCDAFTTGTSAGGCLSNLQCEPSYENLNGTSTEMYCVPFPVTKRWCENTKALAVNGPACIGATPYSTPTSVPSALPCPNDGNHICVPDNNCQTGYGPTNNAAANAACKDWNPLTPQCYVKGATPLPACTAATSTPTPSASSPKPTPAGCPVDNGDGRINSCQNKCAENQTPRPDGGACKDAYGPDRTLCCTAN